MERAIFLDRDGVINKLPPKYPNEGIGDIRNYVTKWEDFEFLPGVMEAFSLLFNRHRPRYKIIIVSNQGGLIGRRIHDTDWYTPVNKVFKQMYNKVIDSTGLCIDFYFCPHLISDNCACIKPKPGMLYQAAIEHDIVLEDSWMIGDSDTDIAAGWNAGIKSLVKIGGKLGDSKELAMLYLYANDIAIKPSLLEAVKHIMEADNGHQG